MKPILSLLLFLALSLQSYSQSNWGCTDPSAQNYDALADADAGNCCYSNYLTYTGGGNIYAIYYWSANGLFLSYYPGLNAEPGVCVTEGCITAQIDVNSPGYADMTFYVDGAELAAFTADELFLAEGIITLTIGETVNGCIDQFACNFNPSATCNDGSCDYSCFGCTDPESYNYSAEATVDDGSCCSAENYMTLTTDLQEEIPFQFYIFSQYSGYYEPGSAGTPFCLPEGCYQLYPYFYDPLNFSTTVNVTITNANGEIIFQSPVSNDTQQSVIFSYNATTGCIDPNACNFNPAASCNDGSCDYSCFGCTDPEAINYDPQATIDDGSCCNGIYTLVASEGAQFYYSIYSPGNPGGSGYYPGFNNFCLEDGCIFLDIYADPTYTVVPFDWQMIDAEGNIISSGTVSQSYGSSVQIALNAITGCTNPMACNYNPEANCGDWNSCYYDCYGCTDPNAPNYDPEALLDDGTCCTEDWYEISANVAGNYSVYNNNGVGYSGVLPSENGFCMPSGCFSVVFYPFDYSNLDIQVSISENGELLATGDFLPAYSGAFLQVSNGETVGCLDIGACNYNPEATCGDFTNCNYDCYGCTDPNAPNFNPNATIDNGTCCTDNWYTVEMSAPGFWSSSSLTEFNSGYGHYPEETGFCVGDECFQFFAWADNGSSLTYTIYDQNGEIVATGNSAMFGQINTISGEGFISGCADQSACNYDPNVNCPDYYACNYDCYGCTNPAAGNYDPDATIDNGLCCTDTWMTLNMSGEAYWTVYSGYYFYSGGLYPYQNGFCNNNECFSILVYPINGEPVDFTITGPNGEVIYTGVGYPDYYATSSVSLNGEIAGCMDMNACNYNPEATCNDNSCSNYCGGCTDETALNYNAWALYDDGSCFYNPELPNLGMAIIPDEENNQYWVAVNVASTGNGSPYLLRSDYNDESLMVNATGEYMAGPYPCDAEIEFTLQSMPAGMTTYMNAVVEGVCAISSGTQEIEITPSFAIYPNPNNGQFVISGVKSSQAGVQIIDLSGRIVLDEKMNVSGERISLTTDALSNGVYQVRVISSDKSETLKMIVEK
jgi:hypothetical protein